MKEQLIFRLKALELKNVLVETELSLPKNSLSAVLNGKKTMPDKWVPLVEKFLLEKEPPPEPAKPIKDPLHPWIEEIEQYCRSKGFHPDFLVEFHQRYSNTSTTRAIEGLRKALSETDNRKVINPTDPRNRQMREPEPGTPAYYIRKGGESQ